MRVATIDILIGVRASELAIPDTNSAIISIENQAFTVCAGCTDTLQGDLLTCSKRLNSYRPLNINRSASVATHQGQGQAVNLKCIVVSRPDTDHIAICGDGDGRIDLVEISVWSADIKNLRRGIGERQKSKG